MQEKRFLKLKYWRNVLGLKQSDLAILLGCYPSTYTQKENGKLRFTLDEANEIKRAFNERLAKDGKKALLLDDIFLE